MKTDLKIEFHDVGLKDVPRVANEIAKGIDKPVILIEGEMGAGKTTMIKAICKALKVVDQVSSPTFSIVNEYQTELGKPIFHFDLYRLESPEEAMDFGVEEYFDSGEVCLVEWPSLLMDLYPERVGLLRINQRGSFRDIQFYPDTAADLYL